MASPPIIPPSTALQQPSTAAIVISTAILSLLTGYFIGQGSSIGLFGSSVPIPASPHRGRGRTTTTTREGKLDEDDAEWEEDDDESAEGEEDDDESEDEIQNVVEFDANEEYKLVLVVRTDLGMNKGKIAAQCSHATLAAFTSHINHSLKPTTDPSQPQSQSTIQSLLRRTIPYPYNTSPTLSRWYKCGQAKITVKCDSEEQLLELQSTSRELGLVGCVIRDAGRTQIAAGSATVLAIGPGPRSVIDAVSGHLKLL